MYMDVVYILKNINYYSYYMIESYLESPRVIY